MTNQTLRQALEALAASWERHDDGPAGVIRDLLAAHPEESALDREAAISWLGGSELAAATVDHLLSSGLVRPLPTREQIADTIQRVVCGTVAREIRDEREYCNDAADAVLALFSGDQQSTSEPQGDER